MISIKLATILKPPLSSLQVTLLAAIFYLGVPVSHACEPVCTIWKISNYYCYYFQFCMASPNICCENSLSHIVMSRLNIICTIKQYVIYFFLLINFPSSMFLPFLINTAHFSVAHKFIVLTYTDYELEPSSLYR